MKLEDYPPLQQKKINKWIEDLDVSKEQLKKLPDNHPARKLWISKCQNALQELGHAGYDWIGFDS